MLGLFKKHCAVCGRDIDSNMGIKRFGKHFCSDIHSEQYVAEQRKTENLERQIQQTQQQPKSSGGGCGCG